MVLEARSLKSRLIGSKWRLRGSLCFMLLSLLLVVLGNLWLGNMSLQSLPVLLWDCILMALPSSYKDTGHWIRAHLHPKDDLIRT